MINTKVYEGRPVSFDTKDGLMMVNATDMAKAFGKTTKDWLRTESSKQFIDSLSAVRQICPTELVKVNQGGSVQGTWMHEDVAIEFARWLNPTFAIWCNDRIKELLKTGMTTTVDPDELINNPDLLIKLATNLKEERAKSAQLQASINKNAPKIEYHDKVLSSQSTYVTTQIAKELGMSAIALNKLLHALGIIFKIRGEWVLYSKYQDKGYTDTYTTSFNRTDGSVDTKMNTVWTEEGRKFIHNTVKKYRNEA